MLIFKVDYIVMGKVILGNVNVVINFYINYY